MAQTDINPEVVAEISNMVSDTLNDINGEFDTLQSSVLAPIQEFWYNENAPKVMPGAVTNLNNLNKGVNESLASLGRALGSSANSWAEANGAGGYFVKSIAEAFKKMACDVVDNKNGFRGMDVDEIQKAITQAETTRDAMISKLQKLRAAGDREGFRGGNMQAALTNVCNTLESQINNGINNILDNITTNTGTARSNVESAKSATESTFTIS